MENKSLQVVYEDVRKLRENKLLGSIVYGGVSRTGTMQKLHYLTRKGAVVVAESEGVELDKVKYPKSTNTLVKNDFLHRVATIDLMIAFDQWVISAGYEKLFFDVYFDTVGSQKDRTDGVSRSKTRINLDRQNFIDPDGIFAYESNNGTRLFVLEVANGHDSKRVLEQIERNLFASYKGLVGDKHHIPQTAKLLVAFGSMELLKGTIQRIIKEPHLRRFEGVEKYLFFGLQQVLKGSWKDKRLNLKAEYVSLFQ